MKLHYLPSHVNETPSSGINARFLAADVQVEEEYTDMGVWVMRNNAGKNRWLGECVKADSWFGPRNYVYGVDIQGNVDQIEPPGFPTCPAGMVPEPDGGCTSSAPATGGGSSGGNEFPPLPGCVWYEYTYWNWSYGQWTPLYTWYACE